MHTHTSIFAWRNSRSHLAPKLGSMLVAALIVAPLNLCGDVVRRELDSFTGRAAAEQVNHEPHGRTAAGSREAMVSIAPR